MNGAESLIKTLVNNGIDICFTNPGTSEMHFVAALDEVPQMRCVLCLFEGVLSGAADGYARMAEKPASTLLHLGPGLGNSLANLHNARKGNVPLVNVVGDHATYHVKYDAPLTSDIEAVAAPMSHWVHTSEAPADIARDAAEAVLQAGRSRIATLILPADVSWGENPNREAAAVELPPRPPVSATAIATAAQMLKDGDAMLMLGGARISKASGLLASRIGRATGARVATDTFPPRLSRGEGAAVIERLPYLAELALDNIKEVRRLVLLGAKTPVSFFAYPGVSSTIAAPECEVFSVAGVEAEFEAVLAALLDAVGGEGVEPEVTERVEHGLGDDPDALLTADHAGRAVAHFMPEDAVIVDEAATSSLLPFIYSANSRRHEWLSLTGGSIGWGLPAAVGASLACPDRKVICLEGDGSAMYTISALWTMARESLDVLVVIFSNRKYAILELEFSRTGARGGVPGPSAASTLDIGSPDMNFAAIAEGMGVQATRATTAAEFYSQYEAAMKVKGPRLIDAVVPKAL